MTAFAPERAIARSIECWAIRGREFDELPDVNCRGACGNYEFFRARTLSETSFREKHNEMVFSSIGRLIRTQWILSTPSRT
jgi:hypothetical protein